MLAKDFKAPKEGEHVCWREFVDRVDEIFTKKGLEKDHTLDAAEVRTQTVYSRREPTSDDIAVVQNVIERFKEVIKKQRLDSKSFFQDFDKHVHFKVS